MGSFTDIIAFIVPYCKRGQYISVLLIRDRRQKASSRVVFIEHCRLEHELQWSLNGGPFFLSWKEKSVVERKSK
jgi:hypothetical protein